MLIHRAFSAPPAVAWIVQIRDAVRRGPFKGQFGVIQLTRVISLGVASDGA